jgi:hypothetical protein
MIPAMPKTFENHRPRGEERMTLGIGSFVVIRDFRIKFGRRLYAPLNTFALA